MTVPRKRTISTVRLGGLFVHRGTDGIQRGVDNKVLGSCSHVYHAGAGTFRTQHQAWLQGYLLIMRTTENALLFILTQDDSTSVHAPIRILGWTSIIKSTVRVCAFNKLTTETTCLSSETKYIVGNLGLVIGWHRSRLRDDDGLQHQLLHHIRASPKGQSVLLQGQKITMNLK